MSAVHLHLLLNHIPVLGTLFGLILFGWATWRRNGEIRKAGLALFVIAALMAIPTFMSGDSMEEAGGAIVKAESELVERHDFAASWALGGVLLLGILSGIALFKLRKQPAIPVVLGNVILSLAVLTCILMAWTANLGGQIRHPEIRPGAAAAVPGGAE